MYLQRTIRKSAEVKGIGIHKGQEAKITFRPAPPSTGIHFVRTDLKEKLGIKTKVENVKTTQMATTIGKDSAYISTVEHCLSVFTAYRIDNLIVEVDGPEVPIVDGSAEPFLNALLAAGFIEQESPRQYAYIKEHIQLGDGEKYAYIAPYNGLRVTCTIDFSHPCIGLQTLDIDINEGSFKSEIARARTFGFMKDVEALQKMGLGLGGSLDNAIILDDERILNPNGLRFKDEFVRHKILDALGDLATAGFPIMGHVVLYKAGHDVMNKLIKLFTNSPSCYEVKELAHNIYCLLYTSPSPRDRQKSRMPSSA